MKRDEEGNGEGGEEVMQEVEREEEAERRLEVENYRKRQRYLCQS